MTRNVDGFGVPHYDAVRDRWSGTPPLPDGGELLLDLLARDRDATDLGNIVEARPGAVLVPGGAGDVEVMVAWCARRGIPVRARGERHSVGGQGLTAGGLHIDMRALRSIRAVGPEGIAVEAGVTLRQVVEAAWARGLRLASGPTGYLRLSVGGVLSVGGISNLPAAGSIADSVSELELVTATGERVRCGRTERPELFREVLGGLGRRGVIVSAVLDVVPAPARVRGWVLDYDSATSTRALVEDVRTLIAEGRTDEVSVRFAQPDVRTYRLHLASYYDAAPPDAPAVLDGLSGAVSAEHDADYLAHVTAVDPLYDQALEAGWDAVHKPWTDLFLPDGSFVDFAEAAMTVLRDRDVSPMAYGLWFPHRRDRFGTSLRLPEGGELVWLWDLLLDSTGMPRPKQWLGEMLRQCGRFADLAVSMGGMVYPIGAPASRARRHWPASEGPAPENGVFGDGPLLPAPRPRG
ncbi:FAD-binding protein [Saccharopolyspora cebuensis]|uniref:FAD-binding protein n=1 Tax=Saccharopolyspora cebuensis TaxID=418759 RepID=A0ABV4CAB8_9PSEU